VLGAETQSLARETAGIAVRMAALSLVAGVSV
jgi:hypothetical protein